MSPYENSQAPSNQNSPFTGEVSSRDFGKLEAKVEALEGEVDALKTQVGRLNDQKNWLIGAGAAIGVVLAALWDIIKSGGSQ